MQLIATDLPLKNMEKLESILQEMVVLRFGQEAWLLIQEQILDRCDFEQHIESYGAQRLGGQMPFDIPSDRMSSSPSRILDATADLMETTVPGVREEIGRHFARGLHHCEFPHCQPDSGADRSSAQANQCATCPLRVGMIVPGSLRVKAEAQGRLEIQCSLLENDQWVFLRGFLSETLEGLDGPGVLTHSETITPDGKSAHSFVIRKERGPEQE